MGTPAYLFLLAMHSYLRWLILPVVLILIVLSVVAYGRCKKMADADMKQDEKALRRFSTLLVILVDLSVLIGLYLYFSYWKTYVQDKDFSSIMATPALRKRLIEHGPSMIIVLILVHLASLYIKKSNLPRRQCFKQLTIFYLIAFVLMILTIPYWGWRPI